MRLMRYCRSDVLKTTASLGFEKMCHRIISAIATAGSVTARHSELRILY